ncbi:MAG: hypothetical protein R3A47_05335 [Polyangiales bacterium]
MRSKTDAPKLSATDGAACDSASGADAALSRDEMSPELQELWYRIELKVERCTS